MISPFESLNFQKSPRRPFVILRPQIGLNLRLQNCLQTYSQGAVTPKLAPSGLLNEPQSDTKSIKYPPLIHTKTDSDFGLLMTVICHQISLDLEAKMASKCMQLYLSAKHSNNIKHQKCMELYQSNKDLSMYMLVKKASWNN